MSTTLGPFHLQRPIGRGGMGVVWAAEHSTQKVPIAVKVDLHPPDASYSAAFLHEIELVAGLDHPNVVMVLEHGIVSREAQMSSGGDLREGARWVAMELAMGGSIAERPPRDWLELLHVASGTCEGLAHSHARGVVHRDIKPANLLLAGSQIGVSTRPEAILDARIVLSDFGISERLDQPTTNTEESVGTPHYMAPEQIEGQWREQGPWTDIYAVGVLLWRLITGTPPHEGRNAFQIYRSHLMGEIGAFQPRFGVPDGMEQVLRKCMAKKAAERFRYAADLRRALDQLGVATGSFEASALEDEPTQRAEPRTATQSQTRKRNRSSPSKGRARNFQLQGAGLSMFGLRTPPLVGRTEECESLWTSLVDVRSSKSARVVVLHGALGSGKSRLASWLSERAHELGVCESWAAQHAGVRQGKGLVRMLANALRTDGLEADELDAYLSQLFPRPSFDLRALSALLAPTTNGRMGLSQRETRTLVLAVVTEWARREGSLVLTLDDAHLDPEALEWIDHLVALQAMRPSPVLVVATVSDEALAEDPQAQELVADLSDDPAATMLEVKPLDSEAQAKLVQTLVGLEGAVAKRLEDRTAGNPLFAVQLIEAWVERGVLLPSPQGFQLIQGAESLIPESLHQIWEARLSEVLDSRSDDDAMALEAAAAIGLEVDHASWLATFPLLEIEPSGALFEELVRRRLLSLTDETGRRWRFVHGILREVLIERARGLDRWLDVNLAAAIQLQQSGRRAPHLLAAYLLEAEVWEQVLEPLSASIADAVDRGDVRDDTAILKLQEVVDRLELPRTDPWHGRIQLIRAGRARLIRELDDAEHMALRMVREAERNGWEELLARAHQEVCRVMFIIGNLDRALENGERAEQLFGELGDGMRATDTAYTIAMVLNRRGDYDAAREKFLACVAAIDAGGWTELLHNPLLGLVILEQRAGNLDRAQEWLERTRAHAEPLGLSQILANCANLEGEIARSQGDLERAGECYRQSAERYQAMGNPAFVYPALNIGVLDVLAGRYSAATERMRLLLAYLRQTPQALLQTYANVVLLASEAAAGNVEEATDSLNQVASYLAGSSVADKDLARMAEKGGLMLLAGGATRPGRRALMLAVSQYRALGRDGDAERLERRL